MSKDTLPPLREEEYRGQKYLLDDLVPGWIVAHSGICSGAPSVKGRRISTCATECFDNPDDYGLTLEQAFAAKCFQAGIDWQRSRKRRERMSKAVTELWVRIGKEREARKADKEEHSE